MFCKNNPSGASNGNVDSLVRYGSLVAGEPGFEPGLRDPESRVLPLDDSPAQQDYNMKLCL